MWPECKQAMFIFTGKCRSASVYLSPAMALNTLLVPSTKTHAFSHEPVLCTGRGTDTMDGTGLGVCKKLIYDHSSQSVVPQPAAASLLENSPEVKCPDTHPTCTKSALQD